MRKTLGGIGGAAIVGVGLVAGVSGPAAVAGTHALGFELTANPTALFMGGLGFEDVDENLMARVLGGRYASGYTLVGLEWPGQIAPFQGTLTLNQSVQAGIDTMMEAIRTTDGVKIVEQMKKMPTDDPLFGKGTIRADGRKLHDVYLFEVKKPNESKGPWDYYKLRATIPGNEAFRQPAQSECPLLKK